MAVRSKPKLPRGRPAQYVKDRHGRPIIGFSRSSQGRYYATHSQPRLTFGSDFDQALAKFRAWQAEVEGAPQVPIPIELPPCVFGKVPLTDDRVELAWPPGEPPRVVKRQARVLIDPPRLYDWARAEILANPVAFAERVGIPQIANLVNLPIPGDSPPLKDILRTYVDRADVTRHERQKSERFWTEFCRFVTGKTLRDITPAQITEYRDWAVKEFHSGRSRTWIAHRFGKVKTILNFAATRGVAPDEIGRVMACCKVLKPPRRTAADPHPISPRDFEALLSVADAKWKAILLCMLNFAMYAKEAGELLKREVDLERRTLVTDRAKTGMVRVAVVWGRTVQAIRDAPQNAGHAYLFQNNAGTHYHPDHIRRGFARLRAAAGLADDVKVSDIRDGAYTAAIEGGADAHHAMLLAGHATGMKDAYVRRNPKMVADACAAIEAYYFPPPASD